VVVVVARWWWCGGGGAVVVVVVVVVVVEESREGRPGASDRPVHDVVKQHARRSQAQETVVCRPAETKSNTHASRLANKTDTNIGHTESTPRPQHATSGTMRTRTHWYHLVVGTHRPWLLMSVDQYAYAKLLH
jgi:hypothetical protein